MRSNLHLWLWCLMVSMVLGLEPAVAGAAEETEAAAESLEQQVDALAKPVLPHVKALVVGVYVDGAPHVFSFGKLSDEDDRKPNGDTVFEIASLTKVFTGVLLADMVLKGKIELDAPISRYLPEGVKVPAYDGRPITVLDLATHTSGLPRMPDNWAADQGNIYAKYSFADMDDFLANHKLRRAPESEYEYSNLGFGLLGRALAEVGGASYEELVKKEICEPLKMHDTAIVLDERLQARFAPPHDAQGKPSEAWLMPAFDGGGALRSTANDMLKFLAADIEATPSPLAEAFRRASTPRRKIAASGDGRIGLGWHMNIATGICDHTGQTAGYHTFMAADARNKVAVVVLTNTANDRIDRLGSTLINQLGKSRQHAD